MSRHSDEGPPGTPGQPDPGPAGDDPGAAASPPWVAAPQPDDAESSLPPWARRDQNPAPPPPPVPPAAPEPVDPTGQGLPSWVVQPAPTGPDPAPELLTPDDVTQGVPGMPGAEGQSRLRAFRRRPGPPTEPHREPPGMVAAGSPPTPDPSESRTIVPGQVAPPGQLGPGQGHPAPVPQAQSGFEPPLPGRPGRPDFRVPPELPSPPVRAEAAGNETDPSGTGVGPPGATPTRAPSAPPAPSPAPRTASGAPLPGQMAAQPRRLSPEQVRTATFARSALGRRGYNEDEVSQFNNRLAEELAARDHEVVRLIDENHRLKQAMRDWQSERIDQPEVEIAERVNAETAALMAKAQQHIDAQLAQTELYCRQREQEAVRRYDEIVRHARLQVRKEAEQVAHRYRATSGAGYNPDQETLQRQQVYIGALLQALDALGAHVQATRQAFATEIGNLASSTGDPAGGVGIEGVEGVDPLAQRVD
jgi:DivIVA domain-containing protein